ncbi:hypothetical protein N0O92_10270 [Alkalihalobacillus sp. MEB130]|uniref:hypothetical protein n=1 Tax=Alkalihalobacillus sp. MEB130 TaxID=2976704 RepID=UPI0028DDAE61|nr:hypothetical protein [Alkalihalobacillus sp. MEB130]MDT8860619.1 hypothetical protein [Alkalihalobacillus sp. MEB130]
MIDLTFEKYTECTLENLQLVDSYDVQHWTHYVVTFKGEIPEELQDPEALVIVEGDKTILQIVLREEGCDSPLFQFTENEKIQIADWFQSTVANKLQK